MNGEISDKRVGQVLLKGRLTVGGSHNRDLVPWALTSMGLLIGRLQLLVCSYYPANIIELHCMLNLPKLDFMILMIQTR